MVKPLEYYLKAILGLACGCALALVENGPRRAPHDLRRPPTRYVGADADRAPRDGVSQTYGDDTGTSERKKAAKGSDKSDLAGL